MKSYDYDAMVFEGEVVCKKHLTYKEWLDAQPVFANSEWDCYPVCGKCGEIHDYVTLTEAGWQFESIEK